MMEMIQQSWATSWEMFGPRNPGGPAAREYNPADSAHAFIAFHPDFQKNEGLCGDSPPGAIASSNDASYAGSAVIGFLSLRLAKF